MGKKKQKNESKNLPKYNIIPYLSIQISSGKFENIIYNYSNLNVNQDDNEDNTVPLSYSYNLISGKIEESEREEFEKAIAHILFDFIQKLEEKEKEIQND